MPESAETVRKAFDALENELAHEDDYLNEPIPTHARLLTATRYQVAGAREIAVQLARIADALEQRGISQ